MRVWDVSTGQQLLVLREHQALVKCIAFSPDGSRLASGARDHTVRLWDASTGEELTVLRGHSSDVSSVAFSPDGTRLASGSYDQTVRLWDTVPFRVRRLERQAILAAGPQAERIVDALRQQLNDWKSVAQRLRGDASLGEAVRHAALNLVLRRAAEWRAYGSETQPTRPPKRVS